MMVEWFLSIGRYRALGLGEIAHGKRPPVQVTMACLMLLAAGGCAELWGGSNPFANQTEFSETTDFACESSFLDDEFGYGVELPTDAVLVRADNEQDSLTNSLWTLTLDGALLNVAARVQTVSTEAGLAEIVQAADDEALFAGASLLLEEQVTLAGGTEAFHSIIDFEGLTTSRVQAMIDDRVFTVEVIVESDVRNETLDSTISDIVLSLCIE